MTNKEMKQKGIIFFEVMLILAICSLVYTHIEIKEPIEEKTVCIQGKGCGHPIDTKGNK